MRETGREGRNTGRSPPAASSGGVARPASNSPREQWGCYNSRMSQHVAIFGATSAIASEVARVYARRGARLYLVGRSADKLDKLTRELSAQLAGSAQQDFDRTDQAEACVAAAVQALGRI